MDVESMSKALKNGLEIFKMKNPSGPSEWKGKFNYLDSTNLTDEVKEQIGYKRHSWNDGIFYISMRDFVENFEIFEIFKIVEIFEFLDIFENF